jgi:hypothetical protein
MANLDWEAIKVAQLKGTTKEYFLGILENLRTVDQKVHYCEQYLNECYSRNTSSQFDAIILSSCRTLYMCLGEDILPAIAVPAGLLSWLSLFSDQLDTKLGQRGGILAIVAFIIRGRDSALYFGLCLEIAEKNVAVACKMLDSDAAKDTQLGVLIVLRQCEDIFNLAGNHSDHVDVTHRLLDYVARIVTISVSPSFAHFSNAQFLVKSAKVFSLLAESCMENIRLSSDVTALDSYACIKSVFRSISTVPLSLLRAIRDQDTLHDVFVIALEYCIDFTRHVVYAKSNDVELKSMYSQWIEAAVEIISITQLTSALAVKRVDYTMSFLSYCLSDFESTGTRSSSEMSESKRIISLSDSMKYSIFRSDNMELLVVFVGSVIQSLVHVQDKMKNAVSSAATAGGGSNKLLFSSKAEIKKCFSELRKTSISTAHNILMQCPKWIVENRELFWRLSLKSLSTPLLLTPGYIAMASDELYLLEMNKQLKTALYNTMRYSPAAMEDVLVSIQELAEHGCVELLPKPSFDDSSGRSSNSDSVFHALWHSLSQIPKVTASSSVSLATAESHAALNWQVGVCVTMNSMVRMAITMEQQRAGTFVIDLKLVNEIVIRLLPVLSAASSNHGEHLLSADVIDDSENRHSTHDKHVDSSENDQSREDLMQTSTVLMKTLCDYSIEVCGNQQSDGTVLLEGMVSLVTHLILCWDRPTVFDDQVVQVCAEMELLSRVLACLLFIKTESRAPRNKTEIQCLILSAIVGLCNSGCGLVVGNVDLRACLKRIDDLHAVPAEVVSESALIGRAALIRFHELLLSDCLAGYETWGKERAGHKLMMKVDARYEAAREALLHIAESLWADSGSGSSAEGVMSAGTAGNDDTAMVSSTTREGSTFISQIAALLPLTTVTAMLTTPSTTDEASSVLSVRDVQISTTVHADALRVFFSFLVDHY